MPDPLTTSLIGVGAAGQLFGGIAGGKGGEDRPTTQIPQVAIDAAEAGLAGAESGLEAIGGAPSPEQLETTTQDVLDRLQELEAVEPTIDADQLAEDIVRTQQEATAPARAQREQAFRETAGAYGPGSELSSQRAAEVAQERSDVAATLANIMPSLKQAEYSQLANRLTQALGIQQAIQQAALVPYQAVTQAHQGYTGQLLGAGRGAFAPQQTERYVSPWGSAISAVGQELTQIPMTTMLLQRLGTQSPATRRTTAATGTPQAPASTVDLRSWLGS